MYKNTRHVLGPWFTCVLLLIVTNIQQGDGHENATWRRVDLGHAFLPPLGSSSHRQMGGGFHFVNSWDVYLFSSSISCTIRASLIVFRQVKQVLKMRLLFFFKCFSNICWMRTPSLITIFPSLPKATTTPLSTVRGRSCNLQKQARIANPSPCMRARMVPGIFFFFQKTPHRWIKFHHPSFLGGGNSNIFYFHPDPICGEDDEPNWTVAYYGLGNSTTKIHQHPVSSLNTLFFLEGGIFGWLCGAVVGPSQVRTSSSWPQRLRLRPIVLWTWIWQRCYLHVLPCNMDAWW